MGAFEYRQAEEIRDVFSRHGVKYLFLGKSGAILLGFHDTTQDADLFVERSPQNGKAIEPLFEPPTAFSDRQDEDPESNLAEDHRIDGDFLLMARQPSQHPWVGIGLGGFAENVGVDQIGHSVSVDSDLMGTKKPFSGQASSQSTRP